MKKALFIDRDGTLIREPEDEQIDSFEKLEFYPEVFQYLKKIYQEGEFELIMVTNQDGLGTPKYPQATFDKIQSLIIRSFENEGVHFKEVIVDDSFADDDSPDRKPNIGRMKHFLNGGYDMRNSFVIGDRLTDVKFAENLGCQAIFIDNQTHLGTQEIDNAGQLRAKAAKITDNWQAIYEFLKAGDRKTTIVRNTDETDIELQVNLDGNGNYQIDTGIGFFDHMLAQLAKHAQVDLDIHVKGDLEVDEHHTIEDTAIALGDAFHELLKDKKGLQRYGFLLPMDESLAKVAIDFGNRFHFDWQAAFKREKIGDMPCELFDHFFKSFAEQAKATLHIKVSGQNEHHKIEAIFKAFAHALKMAIQRNVDDENLPTTKGLL